MHKIYYGWWIVLACFIIVLYVSSTVFFGLTAFFEPLVKEFGWSYTQVSFAASLRGMEMGLFAPLVGFLVDRFGSRKLILGGMIITGSGLICFAFTHSLITYYTSFILLALGAGGCTSVVTTTAVINWFDKNAGKALGIMSSGFGASGLLVPGIVWLIDIYDWRVALLILGIGMWVIGVPLSFIIRNRPEDSIKRDSREGNDSDCNYLNPPEESIGEPSFREALTDKLFMYLNIVEAIRMMTLSAVVLHIMPYLSSLGMNRYLTGMIAAALPLCSIVGRISFGWLGDIHDKRYIMALSYGLMSIGMLALCYADRVWGGVYLFLFFFAPGFGGSLVLRASIIREYYGRKSFGKMVGILMGFSSIGGIIGPTLAGWTFDKTGSYYLIWIAFCLLTLVSGFVMLRAKPSSKN
ncbi:MAG: MFS transporter [Deltaproteobacteria bacterium]|nr:MFS transporter [Deltaproteobacteria bacterium]